MTSYAGDGEGDDYEFTSIDRWYERTVAARAV